MATPLLQPGPARNVALYPWYQFCRNLTFWQAIWFLFFQTELSASQAILLYVIYDIGTTALEVPSGYLSDRVGRRFTLIVSAGCGLAGAVLLSFGSGFAVFALAQVCLGASTAFVSGTDSALLYESLAATGEEDKIETHELRAWRFSFSALAVSAVLGGIMAFQSFTLPFLAGAAILAGVLVLTFRFSEPPHAAPPVAQGGELMRLRTLGTALTQPVLVWLLVLSVLMYGFSHVPYVFGQPFILQALSAAGWASEAPIVSGVTSASMMLVSVLISLIALRLRKRLGLPVILLFAFALQIALIGILALTDSLIAIALLFLRMVPDALSRPFILARIQPMLSDDSRATYLSLQSFCGRLLFAATLYAASLSASDVGLMPYAEIRQVLGWYAVTGLVLLGALALWSKHVQIETPAKG